MLVELWSPARIKTSWSSFLFCLKVQCSRHDLCYAFLLDKFCVLGSCVFVLLYVTYSLIPFFSDYTCLCGHMNTWMYGYTGMCLHVLSAVCLYGL